MSWLGASLAWAWSQVNLWHGRADNAWGTSRVWNSGTSWESAYNSEVTLYNNSQASLATMTTDRNTWQANANTAYVSGTWGSGITWHAQDTADIPAALDYSIVTGSRISWTTSEVDILTFTTDRAGYWFAATAATVFSGAGTQTFRLRAGGTLVDSEATTTRTRMLTMTAPTFLAASSVIKLTGQGTGSGNDDETVTKLAVTFVPTPSYPH